VGLIFNQDNLRIYQGDCLDVLCDMPEESIDVVITSPPYSLGIKYNSYNDTLSIDKYLTWLYDVCKAIKRVLKMGGSFFLNIGGSNKKPYTPIEVALLLRDLFVLQNHIIWVKSISVDGKSWGHFKPINSERYLNHCHESVFHFTKEGSVKIDRLAVGVEYADKSNINRWKGKKVDKRCAGNVWFIPYHTVRSKDEKYNHPASYPVELVERCIKLHGAESPTILDPFLGSGTTLVACKNLKCNGIGIEMDEIYCKSAVERLSA
jgi:site-specific DNA-methyltransferase (adenine-specific)